MKNKTQLGLFFAFLLVFGGVGFYLTLLINFYSLGLFILYGAVYPLIVLFAALGMVTVIDKVYSFIVYLVNLHKNKKIKDMEDKEKREKYNNKGWYMLNISMRADDVLDKKLEYLKYFDYAQNNLLNNIEESKKQLEELKKTKDEFMKSLGGEYTEEKKQK